MLKAAYRHHWKEVKIILVHPLWKQKKNERVGMDKTNTGTVGESDGKKNIGIVKVC